MSESELQHRRRRRRRSPWGRRAVAVVLLLVVFAVGVALGKALNDDPPDGVVVTSVRTLEPLPQQPATTAPP